MRWANISVSVSEENTSPRACRAALSSRWFSMMPLCTTATPPYRCGWAFSSVGRPWVAQRVWPMPVLPETGSAFSRSTRFWSFPLLRRMSSPAGPTAATPAES